MLNQRETFITGFANSQSITIGKVGGQVDGCILTGMPDLIQSCGHGEEIGVRACFGLGLS